MSNPTQNISGINNSFDAFQPPLSPDDSSSSDPITSLAKRVADSAGECAFRSALIDNLNNLSIELLALSKDSALSPSADSSPAVANLRKQVLEEIVYCKEHQTAFNNNIEATPVSNQACLSYTMELAARIGLFKDQLLDISKNPQGTLIGKLTQKFKNFFTN